MSERRQLALLVAGLVALMAVGIGGAAIFPEACQELERLGTHDLAFTDAVDALPLSAEDAAIVEGLGEALGIGPWRGAVALGSNTDVLPSEYGFFVVDPTDVAVLRPSLGIVSAARDRTGLDVFSAGTSFALRDELGETGVFNGEYEFDRCGDLPADADIVAIDRGLAVLRDGDELVLHTMRGGETWRAAGAAHAHIVEDGIILDAEDGLRLLDPRTGELLDQIEIGTRSVWLSVHGDGVLVSAPLGLQTVDVIDGALVSGEEVDLGLADALLLGAVRTPAGIVGLGADIGSGQGAAVLGSDRSIAGPITLPAGLVAIDIDVSQDGHVGVHVGAGGQQALLIFGPDHPAG